MKHLLTILCICAVFGLGLYWAYSVSIPVATNNSDDFTEEIVDVPDTVVIPVTVLSSRLFHIEYLKFPRNAVKAIGNENTFYANEKWYMSPWRADKLREVLKW